MAVAKGVLWGVVLLACLGVVVLATGLGVVSAVFVGGMVHAISTVG